MRAFCAEPTLFTIVLFISTALCFRCLQPHAIACVFRIIVSLNLCVFVFFARPCWLCPQSYDAAAVHAALARPTRRAAEIAASYDWGQGQQPPRRADPADAITCVKL